MNRSAAFAGWDDTRLVEAARGAQPHAYGELFERWYDRCYDVAWGICRDRDAAADVAQDAFCVCWEHLAELRDPDAFGGWILRTTRNQALNRLEREKIRLHDSIDAEEPMAIPDPGAGPDAQAEQDDRRDLIWTAATALGVRDASLLDLHLRHGLGASEIAEELDITPNNASQLLHRLRGQLRDVIGAVVLWRRGRPACRELAGLVGTRVGFDAALAATIRRHRRACASCAAEVRRVQPELLFTGLPIAVAGEALKGRARDALAQAGVPVLAPVPVPAAAPASPASTASPDGASASAQSPGAASGPSGGASAHPGVGSAAPPAARRLLTTVGAGVGVAALLAVIGAGLLPGHHPADAAPAAGGSRGGTTSAAPAAPAPTAPTGLALTPVADRPTGSDSGSGDGAGTAASADPTSARPAATRRGATSSASPLRPAASSYQAPKGTAAPSAPSAAERRRLAARLGPALRCPGGVTAVITWTYPGGGGYLTVIGWCGPVQHWWLFGPPAWPGAASLPLHAQGVHGFGPVGAPAWLGGVRGWRWPCP